MGLCEKDIISDPVFCKPINDYDLQIRDEVRRNMCLKVLVNHFCMIFRNANLGKWSLSKIIGLRIGNGCNIVFSKVSYFALGVIFLEWIKDVTLEMRCL